MQPLLRIENICVSIGEKGIVSDVSLSIRSGEIYFLMGPNGSGKSSLAYAIAGHPEYRITAGTVMLDGQDITMMAPEERAAAGLFLSFQEPPEIGGVSMAIFLKTIAADQDPHAEGERATALLPRLRLEPSFLSRLVNEGFSGGEKKKSELLQFQSRKPKVAILDEIDSGLDLDSLKNVAEIISYAREEGTGFLVITHTLRLFSYIEPDRVHVLIKGKCVASGKKEILTLLEKSGFDSIKQA